MMKNDLTPVYVLHTRPFRNSSLIVELLSQQEGRVSVVANSARGVKSRYHGQLQLFTPIVASWIGRHELKKLTQIELSGMPWQLQNHFLFCGFYLNELLMRLLHKEDPHPILFDHYHHSLCQLHEKKPMDITLRLFEKKLLENLGYGLPLIYEAKTRTPIIAEHWYEFIPQQGFVFSEQINEKNFFSGKVLQQIAQENFQERTTQQSAKRLMRLALSVLLGEKPLNSRVFF